MAGLWRNDPKTPEGKFPIVLRRDGSPVERRHFVLLLDDPAASEALNTYAAVHKGRGSDPRFVDEVFDLSEEAEVLSRADQALPEPISNPDAPPDRVDDPAVLAWARSIGCPGS